MVAVYWFKVISFFPLTNYIVAVTAFVILKTDFAILTTVVKNDHKSS